MTLQKEQYTIKEIADICEMSKTSINRAIEELSIEKELMGNKNYISCADAERIVLLLRGNVLKTQHNETKTQQTATNQTKNETDDNKNDSKTNSSLLDSTENNIEQSEIINFLLEQIKIKDEQIANLQEDNKLLIQTQAFTLKQLENLKTIEKKDDTESAEDSNKKKKSFFSFFKK